MNLQTYAAAKPLDKMHKSELPKVRLAVQKDIPQLIALGHQLHKENELMPLSERAILEAVTRAVRQDRAMLGVLGPVGAIQGGIYLTIGRFWYTDDFHLEELFTYVSPEFRRTENAKALVEFAKSSATHLRVPLLTGIISNDRTAAKVRMYERLLGKPAGAYFLYGAKTGNAG